MGGTNDAPCEDSTVVVDLDGHICITSIVEPSGWRTGTDGLARRAIDGLMGEEGALALPPPENLAAHPKTNLGPNL